MVIGDKVEYNETKIMDQEYWRYHLRNLFASKFKILSIPLPPG